MSRLTECPRCGSALDYLCDRIETEGYGVMVCNDEDCKRERQAEEDDDSLDDLAGLQSACQECGQPFAPLNDTDRLCSRCYVWNKL